MAQSVKIWDQKRKIPYLEEYIHCEVLLVWNMLLVGYTAKST